MQGFAAPRYYWHGRPSSEAPVTISMILPKQLEKALQLREKIAVKTLAIDLTLGLEQGTGAEAEWMEHYKYQGVASLNSLQRDRAIERMGSSYSSLANELTALGAQYSWAENLNMWLRDARAGAESPLVGRSLIGLRNGPLEQFSRLLRPRLIAGVPHWPWTDPAHCESLFSGWLGLDGRQENFPPKLCSDLQVAPDDSTPIRAQDLVLAADFLATAPRIEALPGKDIGRLLLQGASALAAPKFATPEDRARITVRDFFLLQLPRSAWSEERRDVPIDVS
jgi:hypothetical protein